MVNHLNYSILFLQPKQDQYVNIYISLPSHAICDKSVVVLWIQYLWKCLPCPPNTGEHSVDFKLLLEGQQDIERPTVQGTVPWLCHLSTSNTICNTGPFLSCYKVEKSSKNYPNITECFIPFVSHNLLHIYRLYQCVRLDYQSHQHFILITFFLPTLY